MYAHSYRFPPYQVKTGERREYNHSVVYIIRAGGATTAAPAIAVVIFSDQ